jgi:hypothetical protein
MSSAAFILKLEADAKGVERGTNAAISHFKRLGATVRDIEKRKDEQIRKDKELARLAFERLKPEQQLNSLLRTREQIANRIARVDDPRLKNSYLQKQLEIEQRIATARIAGMGSHLPPVLGAPPVLAGAAAGGALAGGMGGTAKKFLGRLAGPFAAGAFGRFGLDALNDPMQAAQLGRAVGVNSSMSQRLSLAAKASGVEPSSVFDRVGELKKGGLSTDEAIAKLDPKLLSLANSFSHLAISSSSAISGLERMVSIVRYLGTTAKALTFAGPNWFNRAVSNQFQTVDAPSVEEMQARLRERQESRDFEDWFEWVSGGTGPATKEKKKQAGRARGGGSNHIDTDELARIGLFRGGQTNTPVTERLDRIHRELQQIRSEMDE